ncbi:MAG TPA: DegQ family serine endoprotease [Dissulfurispiraceae bacterium]|nr:DegQ family serine endoprotease [Dissulfurispiraceae bacterium]
MNKRSLWIPALLLIGFILGGVVYSLFSSPSGQGISPFSPRVPKQIEETSRAFSEIVKAVSPSVVNISSTKILKRQQVPFDEFFDFFNPFPDGRDRRFKEQSLGSGVLVSEDGYIVTNNHVVEQSSEIRVILTDKRTFKAKLIGADPKTDIAIIKIDAKSLPVVPWGDSEKLQVGEFVLAIGNAFGLSNTVTMGIISAVGRADVGIADYEDFIQTDAAINPGNSGGPLVNIKGEIIGINTAIFSKTGGYQGIGFAVPSNMVRVVRDQLTKEGKVTRGWLGVTIQELTPEMASKFGLKGADGVLVSDIAKNSPAAKAGIQRGDIVTQYNGKPVKDAGVLRNMVAQSQLGSGVNIKIIRKDKEMTIPVTIVELPADGAENSSRPVPGDSSAGNALSGVSVTDLTPAISKQLGLDKDEKGVVILRIESGSAAEDAGLRKGDVLQEIDRQKVTSLNEFNRAFSRLRPDEAVLLFVNRGGRKFYTTLEPR